MSQGLSLIFIRIGKLFSHIRNWRTASAHRNRHQWEENAEWYRFRYEDEDRAREMLQRLSRAGGRVALRIRHDDVSRCWIGIEPRFSNVMPKMADAFGCHIIKETPAAAVSGTYFKVSIVPDSGSADAFILNGTLFITQQKNNGLVFPELTKEQQANPAEMWALPKPSLGITPTLTIELPSNSLLHRRNGDWLLGWDSEGHSVGSNQAGIIGDALYIDRWLTSFFLASWKEAHKPVLFIDGKGHWLDRFVKLPVVQSAIHTRAVRHIDVRTQQHSFNPLALSLDQSKKKTALRWLWLFRGMGLTESSLQTLIPLALSEDIADLPGLYKWLKAISAKGIKGLDANSIVPLTDKIEQLDSDPIVREWLLAREKFTDPRHWIKQAPLLVTPRLHEGNAWARLQGIRALIGLVVEVRGAVVLHDIKLAPIDRQILKSHPMIVTNSPGTTTIITRCESVSSKAVKNQLGLKSLSDEYLQLLPPGSAVITHKTDGLTAASWRNNI